MREEAFWSKAGGSAWKGAQVLTSVGLRLLHFGIFSLGYSPSHLVLSLFYAYKRHLMSHGGHLPQGGLCHPRAMTNCKDGAWRWVYFWALLWVSTPGLDAKLSQPTQEM